MAKDPQNELLQIVKSVKNHLQLEEFCGVSQHDSTPQPVAAATSVQPSATKSALTSVNLAEFNSQIKDCQKCDLGATRTNFVFGVGNPRAELVFVGEAPGKDEDLQGIPFVGRAGQLLTKIIEAIDIKREDVYICNVLKCRPPNNRDPKPSEIELCEPYLIRQLEIIQPKVICTLGKFAAQTLLRSTETIMRLRGSLHSYHGIPLIPTLHPAACLYRPDNKKYVWEDIQRVQKLLGET